jgi:DNA-binding NarL/FixJ family response regulator
MPSRPRVLIADDHTLVAELCKRLLESEYDVVGVVGDGRALVRAAEELKPDVIVVDITMPVLNGFDAGLRVKERFPAVKLLYLTMNSDAELAAEALRRGSSGYLLKTCAVSELVTAVRTVLRGKTYLSRAIRRDEVDYFRWQDSGQAGVEKLLTSRQREVLQLLAEGKVMKEIGDILNMKARTVAFHKYRMMETLGAKNSVDLIKYAVKKHMVAA